MTQLHLIHSTEPDVTITPVTLDAFDTFWKLCPRKVGKGKARQAFARALDEGHDAEDIIEGIKAYRQHLRDNPPDDIKYIPHPTTWLNQERWEDVNGLDLDLTDDEKDEELDRLKGQLRQLEVRAERAGSWDAWGTQAAEDTRKKIAALS